MKLEINRVDNGYVVNYYEDDNLKVCVFEERDEDTYQKNEHTMYVRNDDLTVIQNLLYFVLEYFGVNYSKHNDNNITINIEKNNEKDIV